MRGELSKFSRGEEESLHTAVVVIAKNAPCAQPSERSAAADGKAWIAHLLEGYERAGIAEAVVMGKGTTIPAACLKPMAVPCPTGDISSMLQQGLAALSGRESAVFLHPEDRPLVRPHTLKILQSALAAGSVGVRPAFMGKLSFPCLMRLEVLKRILASAEHLQEHDLEALLGLAVRNGVDVSVVETADEGVLLRPACAEDAAWAEERLARPDLFSEAECEALVTRVHGESEGVWAHCRAVSRMAVRLGDALNKAGSGADVELLRIAGLIHDMVRSLPEHGPAAGRLLDEMGFAALADAVRTHQDFPVQAGASICEGELLYLADKLMQGTTCVPVEQRFADKLIRYGDTRENRQRMEGRLKQAMLVKERFESAAGRKVEELFWKD